MYKRQLRAQFGAAAADGVEGLGKLALHGGEHLVGVLAGLEAQLVGLDAGVVLDDARFLAGAADDLAFVEHVVGALLRVGDDVVRAVLGVGEALGDFLLSLIHI